MGAFDRIAEARIREAIETGALGDNPLKGMPLDLDRFQRVPAELRAAYGMLESAGMIPEEMEARGAWLRLRDLLDACEDPAERAELRSRERAASLRYELLMDRARGRGGSAGYRGAVLRRFCR